MVARSFSGFRSNSCILSELLVFNFLILFSWVGLSEKKATSDPDTSAEQNNNTITTKMLNIISPVRGKNRILRNRDKKASDSN